MQKVLGLRGVNYFWNVDEYKDGYKTMSYDRVTALLVEAVKELKKQSDSKIASLKRESNSKIANLEKENAQLKNRLASLEKLEQRMAALEKANSRGTVIGMK